MTKIPPLVSLVALFLSSGCMSGPPPEETWYDPPTTYTYSIVVDTDEHGNFYTEFSDGTYFTDYASYESYVPQFVLDEAYYYGYEPPVQLGEYISGLAEEGYSYPNTESGTDQTTADIGDGISRSVHELVLRIGNYIVTTGPLANGAHVAGCIGQVTDYKYNIRLNRKNPSAKLFDLHLATYTKGGQWCFGAYESQRNLIDYCTCAYIDKDGLRDIIITVAVGAAVLDIAAAIIADIAAPIVALAILGL